MKEKTITFLKKETVKYIFIGGCTTAVNFIFFSLLYDFLKLGLNPSNAIAIFISIIFAFFANKYFVFNSRFNSLSKTFKEFMLFISGRALTMLIEVIGVWLFVSKFSLNEYLSKLFIQIIVLILNYIISKFFVFKKISPSK